MAEKQQKELLDILKRDGGFELSHGTLRMQDLLPDELALLRWLDNLKALDIVKAYFPYEDDLDEFKIPDEFYETENAYYFEEDLIDTLNEFAPDGFYFGSHEGDGSAIGFWELQDYNEEDC